MWYNDRRSRGERQAQTNGEKRQRKKCLTFGTKCAIMIVDQEEKESTNERRKATAKKVLDIWPKVCYNDRRSRETLTCTLKIEYCVTPIVRVKHP